MAVTSRDLSCNLIPSNGALRRCPLLSPSEAMMPCKIPHSSENESGNGYKMRIVSVKQLELSRLTSMDTETPSDIAMRQSPSCASDQDAHISLRRLTEIHDDFLKRLSEQHEEFMRSFITSQTEVYQVLNAEIRNTNGKRPLPASTSNNDDIDRYQDQDLISWLKSQQFPPDTIKKIISEEFTLQDFKTNVTKEDLRDIGLKIGPRCRLWECISRLQRTSTNGDLSPSLPCHR